MGHDTTAVLCFDIPGSIFRHLVI